MKASASMVLTPVTRLYPGLAWQPPTVLVWHQADAGGAGAGVRGALAVADVAVADVAGAMDVMPGGEDSCRGGKPVAWSKAVLSPAAGRNTAKHCQTTRRCYPFSAGLDGSLRDRFMSCRPTPRRAQNAGCVAQSRDVHISTSSPRCHSRQLLGRSWPKSRGPVCRSLAIIR